ncbi:MAG: LytTR family DNA-binding domain-containing protein [Bacteroidales bacterium]|nr:LytTR family DNA-binding domain-containing protein [Bacteroidales bacterium]
MRYFIVEDELPAQRRLNKMIAKLRPDWECAGIAGSVKNALNALSESDAEIDLLWADIQLTDGTSFDLFELYTPKCPVIFTTAYDQYAINAFRVNSIDYILKPISEKTVEQAIVKLEELSRLSEPDTISERLLAFLKQDKSDYKNAFLVQERDELLRLDVKDIAYFYSVNKLTFVKLRNAEEYVINSSLDALEKQLNPVHFYRAARGIILQHWAIDRMITHLNGRYKLVLKPPVDEEIYVSRDRAKLLKDWLTQ